MRAYVWLVIAFIILTPFMTGITVPDGIPALPARTRTYDHYHNSTWYIDNDTLIEGQSIFLRANLIVNASKELKIRNSTLDISSSSPGKWKIELLPGSTLILLNSTIRNITTSYHGFLGNDCSLVIRDSFISGSGGGSGISGSNGIELHGSTAIIENSTITRGDYGLYCNDTALELDRVNISFHFKHGVYLENGTLDARDSLISSNLDTGLLIRFSELNLTGVAYEKNAMQNQRMDLKVVGLLKLKPVNLTGSGLENVSVVVKNSKGSILLENISGPDGHVEPLEYTIRTEFKGLMNSFVPLQVDLNATGFEDAQHAVLPDPGLFEAVMYPYGYFDPLLSVDLKTGGGFHFVNTTTWANATYRCNGYSVKNITIEFGLDGSVPNRTFIGNLSSGEAGYVNFTWKVLKGWQNISVILDIDGNATELNTADNMVIAPIYGIDDLDPVVSLSSGSLFEGENVTITVVNDDPLLPLEYRFKWGFSDFTPWTENETFILHLEEEGDYNISVQASIGGLFGNWSAPVNVSVSRDLPPQIVIEYLAEDRFVDTEYSFDGTGSSWYSNGVWIDLGLEFQWLLDGTVLNETGPVLNISFPDDIEYNVSLNVTDPMNRSASMSYIFKVLNTPPIAVCNISSIYQNVTFPYRLLLSALDSYDIDDEELNFTWSIGNRTYYGESIAIDFESEEVGTIILTVEDDDNARSNAYIPFQLNQEKKQNGNNGRISPLWFVCCGSVVVIMVILILLVVVVLIRDPDKLDMLPGRGSKVVEEHLQLDRGKKIDFVIIQKGTSDDFKKYELYELNGSDDEICIVWSSRNDEEWLIIETNKAPREVLTAWINNKLDRDTSRKWEIDYYGNGKIVSGGPVN